VYDNWINAAYAESPNERTSLPLDPVTIQDNVRRFQDIYGVYCSSTEDVDYLAHIGSLSVARDLDLVRNLTGYNTSNIFGWTYGSIIGIAYASLFPRRVERILLDRLILLSHI
jgi:pimeloyl-ACP methyl ester carboxylesterase